MNCVISLISLPCPVTQTETNPKKKNFFQFSQLIEKFLHQSIFNHIGNQQLPFLLLHFLQVGLFFLNCFFFIHCFGKLVEADGICMYLGLYYSVFRPSLRSMHLTDRGTQTAICVISVCLCRLSYSLPQNLINSKTLYRRIDVLRLLPSMWNCHFVGR